nr:serine hydrolase domain-containing protein [Sphingomonas populi]
MASAQPTRTRRGWTAFAAVALLSMLTAASDPDDEALYRERFATLMQNGGVILKYDPMEPVVGSPAPQPLPVAAAPSIAPQALDAAVEFAARMNSTALIVWRNGKIEREAYFKGRDRSSELVSKSLSKPLSAIAVGRAIELGKIKSLDQSVADFIPEWRGTPKAAILVRHLLDMRSGLLEQMVSPDPDHPINRAYISPNLTKALIDYPLIHPPGTQYGYANAVADLIAVVIERATGERYADFVGKRILAPIGAPGGQIWVSKPGGLAHAGCCMTLPAESFLRLAILLADDGVAGGKRLLPRGYVAQMVRGTPQNPHYGLGVWIAGPYVQRRGFAAPEKPGPKVLHAAPYLDRDLFLFDGNSNQTVYVSRAARLVVLRMGDNPPAQPEWDNSYLPNLLLGNIRWKAGARRPLPQPAQ